MPSVAPDRLSSLLSDLIVAFLRAAVLGMESALVGVSLPIPVSLLPREPERPTNDANGSASSGDALASADRDLGSEPGAEGEVDLDELVGDLEKRLTGISVDLSAVTEFWDQMDQGPRAALLDQLRYYGELHAFFSKKETSDRGGGPPSTAGGERQSRATASSPPKAAPGKKASRKGPTPGGRGGDSR